jgi:hypothetical protein
MLLLNRLHMRYSTHGRKMTRTVRNAGILFLCLGVIVLCGFAMRPQKLGTLAFGLAFLGAGVGLLVVAPRLLRNLVLKAYEKKPDKDLVGVYELSEQGLSFKNDVTSSDLLWRAIPKVQRFGEGFILYVTDTQVHWLPIRGFQVRTMSIDWQTLPK